MKKTFKRAGVAVLSMAMLLSMGAVGAMSASAVTTNNNTITVAANNRKSTAVASTENGSVNIYQVAVANTSGAWSWNGTLVPTVSYTKGNKTVSAVKVVFKISNATKAIKDVEENDINVDATDYEILITDLNETQKNDLANQLKTSIGEDTSLRVATGKAGTAVKLEDQTGVDVDTVGYYLVVTTPKSADITIQPTLVQVDGTKASSNTDVSPKGDDIPLSKIIEKVNNDTSSVSTTGKSATAIIGSVVEYKITTKLPTYSTDVAAADIDDFVIYDNPDKGISINTTDFSATAGDPNGSNLIVKINNVEAYNKAESGGTDVALAADSDATKVVSVRVSTAMDGNNSETNVDKKVAGDTDGFVVTIPGAVVKEHQGEFVTVTFKAVVNEDATTGTTANNNDVLITYGNNYSTGGGSTTKKDRVPLYSGKIDLVKYGYNSNGEVVQDSGSNKRLVATFELYDSEDHKVGDDITTSATGSVSLGYLAAGTYRLHEKIAPTGYQVVADYSFTIKEKATSGDTEYNQYTITKQASDNTTTINSTSKTVGTITTSNADGETAIDNIVNLYTVTITDIPVDTLPGTGGMGTVLFTVGGAAIVLAAGAMFVVYMRKRKNEE